MNDNTSSNNGQSLFGPADVIYRYTRAQAIDDGVLVDLTPWASETGFVIPVACTCAVWQEYIVPPQKTRCLGQSERGRAHDLLWMLFNAIRRQSQGQQQILFKVIFLQSRGRRQTVQFKAICGPGDSGEPVITILLPHED